MCPQFIGNLYMGIEDCLVINIFKPNNTIIDNPVVVYIHGGAFAVGSGNTLLPRSLTSHDIVSVTFNYRLGPHGFLCLHNSIIPGNAGLRDQWAALRWVQRNIRAFGGNPQDVTLAGYSAGAASAELLMLSPASRNLFHKVLLESGSGTGHWAYDPNPIETAQGYGQALQAPNVNDTVALANFFASLPIKQLLSQVRFAEPDFTPCIEGNVAGVHRILTQSPTYILENNLYEKMPLMTGYTNAEGLLFLTSSQKWIQEMNENFADHLPPLAYRSEEQKQRIARQVRHFYFGDGPITDSKLLQFIQYYTDITFSYYIINSARLHKSHGASVFLYEFRYVDSQHLFGLPDIGADHCAQTFNALDAHLIDRPNDTSSDDDAIKASTVRMWASFIKNE